MSTRGLYGIRKNGKDKLTYNHADSYPDCLGRMMAKLCDDNTIVELTRLYDLIEMIDTDIPPTQEQIKICKDNGYAFFEVATGREDDWYCLLHNLQGNIYAFNKAIEKNQYLFMSDDSDFIKDSLWCEYAYIINLDTETLEFYKGFQKKPQNKNRYGSEQNRSGYYPCALCLDIPLSFIKKHGIELCVEQMNNVSNEDN